VDERAAQIAKRFELPILIASVLVIPVIVIEESHVSEGWKHFGVALNWVIWGAFAVEMIVMLTVVPFRARWLRENPLEVAIVVLTPPVLPASLQALRIFRLLRLLRLMRVAQLSRRLFSLEGLRYVALLALLTVLGAGAAFAALEKHSSTWDGVWWAFTTMTTVGYGDKVPITVLGRTLAMAVMLVGIGFIAILTGAVAQRFLSPQLEEISEFELEAAGEIEAAETDILAEVREIRARLGRLQAHLERQRP
jgi:voltage-gated potassium channel